MRRNNWKKSMVLMAAITALALTGCAKENATSSNTDNKGTEIWNETGLPIVNSPVSLTIAAVKFPFITTPYNEMQTFEKLQESTGVQVEWQVTPTTGWNEKRNLIFAGNDLPDAFYGLDVLPDSDLINYGSQGLLIPLEDLIDQYAPNLKAIFEQRPEYKKSLTAPDGHIYSLPVIVEKDNQKISESLFMNKKWLDQLQLPVPTTTEEFYETLKAFKEQDPNQNGLQDEVPFSFASGNYIYSMFGSFGLLDNANHIVLEDNKVVFTAMQNEYKEAISYFHRLYKEGLIDLESFTQDTNVYYSKGKKKKGETQTLGSFLINVPVNMVGDNADEYVALPPLKGPDGDQQWNRYDNALRSKGAFAITSANAHPEVTMRWIDQVYETRNSLEFNDGPFGINLKENADGTIERLPVPEGSTFADFRHKETPGGSSVYALLDEMNNKYKYGPTDVDTIKTNLYELYKPYLPTNIYPNIFFPNEDIQKLAQMKVDIGEYVDSMQAKWIIEGTVDKDWDDFQSRLKKMGAEEMIQIYQDNYDRYKSIE